LEGRQVDVESIRNVALQLAGGVPTVQKIFKRVRGGSVPLITFKTQGRSVSDFKDKKNIFIQGSMVDGKISILKAGLDLEGVNGDAVISQGILVGKNLVARYGNSWGRDGTLRVGLKRKPAPLHLDIGVTADVVQIPPVLKRLVKSQSFQKELEQIKNLRGKASGRLWLGESTAAIKVRVDVSEFVLAGNYGRIPYPLAIQGGRFSYKGKQVEVGNLRGKLGQTSFAQLSAGLNWEREPALTVTSGKYEVLLEEIFPWLVSVESLPINPDDIKTVVGVLAISSLSVKGPLLRPQSWEFASTGIIRNLTLNTTLLPGLVEVTAGKFTDIHNAGGQKFSFSGAQISMLDSSFKVRGDLQDYLKGLKDADITFEGDMGPEATQWLSHLIRLPAEVYPRPPLLISHARLLWRKGTRTSFTGDLVAKNGTRVSIDATRNPGDLIINKLLIQDEASHASIQLDFKNRECGLDFIGHLSKTTIDNLLAKTPIAAGWIRGDFHTQIVIDHPMQSTAHGKLAGQSIVLQLKPDVTLNIDSVSLDAASNKIKVASAVVTWEDTHMVLAGDVNFSEEELLFDLDLSTSSMDWVKIKKIFEKKEKKENKLLDLPLRGTVRLKSESFRFEKFTWSPLQADISFNPDEININVKNANLCSISTPGVLKVSSQDIQLDFKPGSHYQSLDPALTCLFNRSHQIDGKFKLAGNITGQGKSEELIQSLHGKLRFDARDGRIYRSLILARILAFINVTEIFNGSFTDLEKEGFGYKKIKIKTKIKKGRLRFKEISMDGNTLTLTGKGTLDLKNNALDLTLLVAPLKTVDRLVDKVPLVGDIIGDIISIPFRVKGDVKDPKVVPLSPSAIGADLIGIMQKTLKLPFKIFQPI
ncbi:MAG: YhdP family protein, partial [Planctomycetota bacterium]